MMSPELLANVEADNSTDPLLYLLTIDHADLSEPIRWVADKVGIVSRGQSYVAYGFDFVPPGETEDGRTPARLAIDNVDKRIVETIRAIATPPTLLIESVLRSDPDTVQEEFPIFSLTVASGDRNTLQADMLDDNDDNEPVMRWKFTPGLAPALFK